MPGGSSWPRKASSPGVRIRAPMMQIHTVAAGGGSICRFDGMRFRVGPESAGAQPGPACYRNGGPLTVTDCNLVLGRIDAGAFPGGVRAGWRPAARRRGVARAAAAKSPTSSATSRSLEQIAEGFLAIAVDNMAAAIRKISIARGHDVTLLHPGLLRRRGRAACLRGGRRAGDERILIHPLAGRAVGARHRPGRRQGDPRGELDQAARRGFRRGAGGARSSGASTTLVGAGDRSRGDHHRAPRAPAAAGQRLARSSSTSASGMRRHLPPRSTASASAMPSPRRCRWSRRWSSRR